jgi:fumarylpyruvate hydrolase
MSAFVVPPPTIVKIPVVGGGAFPVRRIFCVGRNYAEHMREMGDDPSRDAPFFFTKPADAVVTGGADMPYPTQTNELHYEVELVAAIGIGGDAIPVESALDHVWGYAVGLDMTRRDMQAEAKKKARPWDMAKGFDRSAPIGDIVPASTIGHPDRGLIELKVNDQVCQTSDLGKMIWSVPETIAYLSNLVRLAPGDLIFTGTPEAVGGVVRGDVMVGQVEGVGLVKTRVV